MNPTIPLSAMGKKEGQTDFSLGMATSLGKVTLINSA